MSDQRIQRWAEVLVQYSVGVKPGQTVAIQGGIASDPLMRAVFREVLRAGGIPIVAPILPWVQRELFSNGTDEQLSYISPIEHFVREEADVAIQIMADQNTRSLTGIDPSRQGVAALARTELIKTFLSRASDGRLNWTLTLYPTDAFAQDAGLSTEQFAEFVYEACKLNADDPVATWREIGKKQQILADWLTGKNEIHVTGPDTDLKVGVTGRKWENCDGTKNFPDGEIFTGPVETEVNGHVRFSYPVVAYGREIRDIRLTFKDGLVVEATAATEQDFLVKTLDTDPGARRLGEFAFGTNFDIQTFSKSILFDEKIGGTIHMACGAGYPETGSTNQSSVHWDMICDLREGGRVTVDGELFMENGNYVLWS